MPFIGLGIQNDDQTATYLRRIGRGHHPVASRTLLFIILCAIKGGGCGGLNDYRVFEAQEVLNRLREAPEIDEDAIKVAEEALEYAIELQDIMSKGKSEGGIKGGSCGGDNDHRVVKALKEVEVLSMHLRLTKMRSKPQ